jgi:HPt (histidine-containing phosphotransfer) domain-containing protein
MIEAQATREDPIILDPVVLEKLRKVGGNDLIRRMAQAFLGHALGQFEALEQAIQNREGPKAEKAAHSLSSSAGNLGGRLFRILVREAEIRSTQGDWDSLTDFLPKLRSHFEALVSAIRAEIER